MTMALVQQRQEVILQQLEDLKKQMTAIRDTLRTSSTTSCAVNAIKGNVKNTSSCDSLNVSKTKNFEQFLSENFHISGEIATN